MTFLDYLNQTQKIKLEHINIPKSIWFIPEKCFANCTALKEIDIPDSVTIIQSQAFKNCESLSKVKLSNNVTELYDTFTNCINLFGKLTCG